MTKKVAILGLAPSYKLAPFEDSTWEIWGLNDGFSLIPRCDKWFEMHDLEFIKQNKNRFKDNLDGYYEWFKASNIPVYMQNKCDEIVNSIEYPIKEILNIFGSYFTNTVSYMIALAIYEGYEEIALYGVDMADATEYGSQRPSVEYLIGFARGILYAKGKDINLVYIPESSDLLKTTYLYGYEMMPNGVKKIVDTKIKDIENAINILEEQEIYTNTCLNNVDGAINYFNHIKTKLLEIVYPTDIYSKIVEILSNDGNSLHNSQIEYTKKKHEVIKELASCKGKSEISKYYRDAIL